VDDLNAVLIVIWLGHETSDCRLLTRSFSTGAWHRFHLCSFTWIEAYHCGLFYMSHRNHL